MTTTTYLYANAAVFAALGVAQIILLLLLLKCWKEQRMLWGLVNELGGLVSTLSETVRMQHTYSVELSGGLDPNATYSTTPVSPCESPSAGLKGPHCGTEPLTPSSRVGYVKPPSGTSPSSS